MISLFTFIIAIGLSYLIGSLNSAVIVCQLCKLPDPRSEGSKNPGATNVLRLAGKKYAVIVLLADMLKGFIPVFIAHLISVSPTTIGYMCLAVVLGHIYPLFFDFKGGKGVATALGAALGLHTILGLSVCLVWLTIAFISRYSSLASIVAISLIPIMAPFFSYSFSVFLALLIMSFCVLYKHQDNFKRLQKGQEPKIGEK